MVQGSSLTLLSKRQCLGRPPKKVSLEEQKQAQLEERIRNEIDERPRAVARR